MYISKVKVFYISARPGSFHPNLFSRPGFPEKGIFEEKAKNGEF
jgi:hypothetical protein